MNAILLLYSSHLVLHTIRNKDTCCIISWVINTSAHQHITWDKPNGLLSVQSLFHGLPCSYLCILINIPLVLQNFCPFSCCNQMKMYEHLVDIIPFTMDKNQNCTKVIKRTINKDITHHHHYGVNITLGVCAALLLLIFFVFIAWRIWKWWPKRNTRERDADPEMEQFG